MTYEELLTELAGRDPDLIVLTAENRAAIRGLPEKLGDRFIDVGIAEQTMIGAAAGLALRGRRPIAHALASFLTMRAFEFIRTDIGIPGLPVILMGCFPGFLSEANGPTHQAVEDVALMRGIPGMGVFCPAGREELLDALPRLLETGGPWYVRYVDGARGRIGSPVVPGKADRVQDGSDVMFLTYGVLLNQVEKAAERLRSLGMEAGVLNLRFLEPVDEEALLKAAGSCRLLVTVEDHFRRGGLRTVVDEVLSRHRLSVPLRSIDLGGEWFRPALLPDILQTHGFTGEAIADRVQKEFPEHAQ